MKFGAVDFASRVGGLRRASFGEFAGDFGGPSTFNYLQLGIIQLTIN